MNFFKALTLFCILLVATDALILAEHVKPPSQSSLGEAALNPGCKAASNSGPGTDSKPEACLGATAGGETRTPYEAIRQAAGKDLEAGNYAFYWDKIESENYKSPFEGGGMDKLIKENNMAIHRTLVVDTVRTGGVTPEFEGFQCDLAMATLFCATSDDEVNDAQSETLCLPFEPEHGTSGLQYIGPVPPVDEATLDAFGQ